MKYYIKKLGRQELGSVSKDGKPQRGRYFYISKDRSVLDFFPPLSEVILNDSAMLPIIPLYKNVNDKVYCNFVYHNDKIANPGEGTRDEYRLYLNMALENNTLLFKENDIVIFKSEVKENLYDGNQEPQKETVYYLDLISDKESSLYKRCFHIIENSSIRGGFHAVVEDNISEIEDKIKKIQSLGNSKTIIDTSVTNRVEPVIKNKTDVSNLFNANSFHDFVMFGYDEKCAITRTVIRYRGFYNLEAAHIKPKSHGGLYIPNNGIALTRDMHWAFDKGFFTIDEKLKVKVHPDIESDYLRGFNGQKIFVPENQFFAPDISNLLYHNQNVYGRFLTTGRL